MFGGDVIVVVEDIVVSLRVAVMTFTEVVVGVRSS